MFCLQGVLTSLDAVQGIRQVSTSRWLLSKSFLPSMQFREQCRFTHSPFQKVDCETSAIVALVSWLDARLYNPFFIRWISCDFFPYKSNLWTVCRPSSRVKRWSVLVAVTSLWLSTAFTFKAIAVILPGNTVRRSLCCSGSPFVWHTKNCC